MSPRGSIFDQDEAAHFAARSVTVGQRPPEEAKARGRRSVAIALGLAAFVLLVFVITIARLQGHALSKPF